METSRRSIKKYIILAMSILLIASMAACTNEEIVAKVDNVNISKDELYDMMVDQIGAQALDTLIGQKIVEMELKKENIKITDEEVEAEIVKLQDVYGGEEIFNQTLANQGMTVDDMKENIVLGMQLKKLLEPKLKVSEDEIESFFEENKDYFKQEEQVKASHILVETEEEAKDIKAKLEAGEDFAELAKEYSTDKGSGALGGELGFFGRGEMTPSFEEAAFSLKVDEISQPVKSEYGYHIIKVEEKQEAKESTLEDVQEDIKDALIEEKLPQAYQEWYAEKYKEYKVTNTLNPSEK